MTNETKIGLIVGLGFIILFAIILSEKGATNNTRAPSALTLADSSEAEQLVADTSEEPLHNAGELPIHLLEGATNRFGRFLLLLAQPEEPRPCGHHEKPDRQTQRSATGHSGRIPTAIMVRSSSLE